MGTHTQSEYLKFSQEQNIKQNLNNLLAQKEELLNSQPKSLFQRIKRHFYLKKIDKNINKINETLTNIEERKKISNSR